MEVLHPLRILAQPDAEITTVIHSFFVLAYDSNRQSVDTLARHPLNRKNIDDAEDGLKQFLSVPGLFESGEEFCLSHVMTNHDGRLFLYSRCYNRKVIAVASALPILPFFRSLLTYLETVPMDSILPTIYTFCEFPILPLPCVHYEFEFAQSKANIRFGNLQNIEDTDMDMIAMTLFTPIMIVKAWEALILERSILVVSKDTSLLLPCCEFLRKLISPMSYSGTYIPIMPSIELLDATGTFLMGCEINLLISSGAQLSGLVVVDLDRRTIVHTPIITGQNLPEDPYYGAPACLLQNLYRQIVQKTQDPLGKWLQRPFHKNGIDVESSLSPVSCSKRCCEVLKIFSFLNTALLSAQCCSTKGFFRTVIRPELDNLHYVLGLDPSKEGVSRMGFSEYFGFTVGCMQLWKDTELVDDAIHHTIFCWIELDNTSLSVYEHADDLPLLLIPIEEIGSVASCSIEPEGYVFEITLKNQLVFRFTSGDPHSRQLWLNAIEQKLANKNKNQPSPALQTLAQIRNIDFDKRLNLDTEHFAVRDLGQSPFLRDLDPSVTAHYHEFRNLMRRTQSVLSLYGETQSSKFETLFTKRRENLTIFLTESHQFEMKMKKYISNIYRTCDMLAAIKKDIDQNRLDVPSTPSASSMVRSDEYMRSSSLTGYNNNAADAGNANTGVSTRLVKQASLTGDNNSNNHNHTEENDSSKRRSGGLFGFLSGRKRSAGKDLNNNNTDEAKPLSAAEIEKEANEKFMLVTVHKLFLVTLAYNRALSEINTCLIEDRYKTFQKILEVAQDRPVSFHFNVADIITVCQTVHSAASEKYRNASTSGKSPFRSKNPQFSSNGHVNGTSTNNMDSSLFDVLCEVLVPPSVAYRNQFGMPSRTTSYSQHQMISSTEITISLPANGNSHLKTPLSGSNDVPGGDSVMDMPPRDSSASPSPRRSPIPSQRIQFDDLHDDSMLPRNSAIDISILQESRSGSSSQSPVTAVETMEGGEATRHNPTALNAVAVDMQRNSEDGTGSEHLTNVEEEGEDSEFDIKEFLASTTDEYENMINSLHQETKKQVLSYLLGEESKPTKEDSLLTPIMTTLIGYVYHHMEDYHKAIDYYSRSNLVNPSRISQCLLKLFVQRFHQADFATTFSEPKFIMEACRIKNTVGMHAYRLILELVYAELKATADKREGAPIVDASLTLGNFRSFFRSGQQPGRRAKPATSTIRAEFEWSEPPTRSDVLNEAFICTKLTSELTPCEISTQLLVRLREVLRTYAASPAGDKHTKKMGSNLLKIKISTQTIQDIQNLSAFKKFELESCQLQKLDMTNANTNERLLIFTNVYNMLIIHSIIAKGSPGNTLLERTSFMRSARYNVAGHIFSLIDIEHGILRNASTKPMLLGPLSFDMSFSERDPRRRFALDVPKPNISFCLFQASASSPPLCVLNDVNNVDKEMSRYAKHYFLDSVKFDYSEKAIYLPALVKVYWADFGSKQNDVLRYIAQTAGSQFAAKTKEYLASIGGSSAKTHFATLDWTPVFIISDS